MTRRGSELLTREEFGIEAVEKADALVKYYMDSFIQMRQVEYNVACYSGLGSYKVSNLLFKFDRAYEICKANLLAVYSLLYALGVLEYEEYHCLCNGIREKVIGAMVDAFPLLAVDIYEYFGVANYEKFEESEVKATNGKGND